MRRLVDTRCIDEDDLAVRIILDAEDARPCRLRLVGDDGELVADDPIEKRGLAGIRPAEKRDETGSELTVHPLRLQAPGGGGGPWLCVVVRLRAPPRPEDRLRSARRRTAFAPDATGGNRRRFRNPRARFPRQADRSPRQR